MLAIDDLAPDFRAETSDGTTFRLSDYKNKNNIVLFFYTKDFSPICTKQACQFRDEYEYIKGLNCEIIGVSYDSIDRHREFKKANRLPYHLVSDQAKNIARKYEVTRFGGYLPFVKRVTYVIDKSGMIRNAIHHEFNIVRHVQAVRNTLREIAGSNL